MIVNHLAAHRGLVCMGLLLTLHAPLAYAQLSSAGTFSGLVTDQQGAAVADAALTLLDTSTNTTQRTATNEAGRYFFLNVAPGVYDLSVNKSGFNAGQVNRPKVAGRRCRYARRNIAGRFCCDHRRRHRSNSRGADNHRSRRKDRDRSPHAFPA